LKLKISLKVFFGVDFAYFPTIFTAIGLKLEENLRSNKFPENKYQNVRVVCLAKNKTNRIIIILRAENKIQHVIIIF